MVPSQAFITTKQLVEAENEIWLLHMVNLYNKAVLIAFLARLCSMQKCPKLSHLPNEASFNSPYLF